MAQTARTAAGSRSHPATSAATWLRCRPTSSRTSPPWPRTSPSGTTTCSSGCWSTSTSTAWLSGPRRRPAGRTREPPGRVPGTGPAAGPRTIIKRSLQLGRHRLDLGVSLQDLVAHFPAPAGLLVPAERQGRVEHVVAVDPDRAGPQLLGQRVRLGDVLGPDPGAEAVLGIVGLGRDLVDALERGRHYDRAEDLLADDLHVRAGVGDDGGLDEIARVAEAAAAGEVGRTVGLPGLQEAGDPAQLLVRDQRAHLGVRFQARAELDGLGDLRHP